MITPIIDIHYISYHQSSSLPPPRPAIQETGKTTAGNRAGRCLAAEAEVIRIRRIVRLEIYKHKEGALAFSRKLLTQVIGV